MKYSFPVGDFLFCESKLAFLFKPALVQRPYLGPKGCFLNMFFSWRKISALLLLTVLATCRRIYVSDMQKTLKLPGRSFRFLCFNVNGMLDWGWCQCSSAKTGMFKHLEIGRVWRGFIHAGYWDLLRWSLMVASPTVWKICKSFPRSWTGRLS